MKKIITILTAAFICVSVKSAQIDWSVAANSVTQAFTYDGQTGSITSRNGLNVYFMFADDVELFRSAYAGGGDYSSYVLETKQTTNAGGAVPNHTLKNAGLNPYIGENDFAVIITITINATNSTGIDSEYYGEYYAYLGNVSQVIQSDTNESLKAAFAIGNNQTGWVPINTPIPVPEPATAAMALAGLALLFRRKRK